MEEVLKDDGFTTQRELAKRLDISVGLVNAFIKRVVRKGYFKVTTIPGRRVRYLLTPKGFAEKSRLTLSYLRYSISYFQEIRLKLRNFTARLKEDGVNSVVLVGTGEVTELLSLALQESSIEIVAVVSLNGAGEKFLGFKVEEFDALRDLSFDAVCIMDLEEASLYPTKFQEIGILNERIYGSADL